jgi:predicted lipoprotein with Yx(FWY)xxD motif
MAQATAVIATADNADLGTILTDTSGRTLYLFTKDAPGIWPNPNIHAMKCKVVRHFPLWSARNWLRRRR